MKGHIVKRNKQGTRWAAVIERPRVIVGGLLKRKQVWITIRGTREDAEQRLNEELGKVYRDEFIEPDKITFHAHLTTWNEESIKPNYRPSTYQTYTNLIRHVGNFAISRLKLQKVRSSHLENFYTQLQTDAKLSPSTIDLMHSMISSALAQAVRDTLVPKNIARVKINKPAVIEKTADNAEANCWTPEEARAFLVEASKLDGQSSAFYAFALDTGCRISEILGTRWADVNLDASTVKIAQQLDSVDPVKFGPTKGKRSRTIHLDAETVRRLRVHRARQNELKMRYRTSYQNHDLVFACEKAGRRTELGQPMRAYGKRIFYEIMAATGVKRVTFHALRHTMATALISAGTPIHVVSDRLGHKNVATTLTVYLHALPSQQKAAAQQIGALIYGR